MPKKSKKPAARPDLDPLGDLRNLEQLADNALEIAKAISSLATASEMATIAQFGSPDERARAILYLKQVNESIFDL